MRWLAGQQPLQQKPFDSGMEAVQDRVLPNVWTFLSDDDEPAREEDKRIFPAGPGVEATSNPGTAWAAFNKNQKRKGSLFSH